MRAVIRSIARSRLCGVLLLAVVLGSAALGGLLAPALNLRPWAPAPMGVRCYDPGRGAVFLQDPYPAPAQPTLDLPRGILNFSDAAAWLQPVTAAPSALHTAWRSQAACHTSHYRWPIAWSECLLAAASIPNGFLGTAPDAPMPFDRFSNYAVHTVTSCNNPLPTFYASESSEAQAWIHAAQHPADPSNATIGVSSFFNSGMGSSLHGIANSFMLALARGHVWVQPVKNEVGSGWGWASCLTGTMECTFEPVSNLTAPASGLEAIDGVCVQSASPKNDNMANRIVAIPRRWAHKGFHWWHVQVMTYLLRPNPTTIQALVAAASRAFADGLPRPLATVFLRHGDKAEESPVYRAAAYLQLLRPAMQLGVRDVFISSDTQEVNDEATSVFQAAGLTVYSIPRDRGSSAVGGSPVRSFTGHFTLDLLLDLYLLAAGDVMAGLSTSNWSRLADELRLGLGHGAQLLPFLDPLGVPFMEW